MKKILTQWSKRLSAPILGATFLLSMAVASAQDYSVPYTANYKGFSGEAVLAYSQTGNQYKATLTLKPSRAFRIIVSSIVDTVEGTIENGTLKPTRYNRVQNGDKNMLSVAFTDSKAFTTDEDGKQRSFTIAKDGQDPLSQILQIQYDLQNSNIKEHYHLVTDSNQRTYQAIRSNNQVSLIEQGVKGTPRRFVLSFDGKNGTLSQMEKFKNGKPELSITQAN